MPALRITAGSLRGRRIDVPSEGVRPTSERARQAYFNIVGPRIIGSRFLDLFSGSGIFSFEAVSRGAASAVAVDSSRRNVTAVERLALEWRANVRAVAADCVKFLGSSPPFDLAYADPPYDYDRYGELLAAFASAAGPGALIAIEHRRKTDPFGPDTGRLRLTRRGEYGEIWISFFSL